LFDFQKSKVVESGSTSYSEDFHYEPANVLRDANAAPYLKKHHAD
jgi:hypothetical protein